LLLGANITNIYADLNVMAASAKMLFHGPFVLWLTGLTALIVAVQITVPYRAYVRILKWLSLTLFAYVVTALLPGVPVHWGEVARHFFVPEWQHKSGFLLTVVSFLGTTISPYLFFWQAGEEVEEEVASGKADRPGHRIRRVSSQEIRDLRADTVIGMLFSQLITFFIIVCTTATLHAQGKTDINTAQDAARALLPLGPVAYWLFTLGILGTGLLAIPTLAGSAAYAVAVKGLLYSAAINGVVAPPLIVILLLICNNRTIIKDRGNGWLSNLLGILTVLLMGATAVLLLWAMATGHV
jgi:Mn2+/Fe2+ NRAMP family transporter